MPEININNLEKELRKLVAEITEVDTEKITPEAKFVEDLGMDSMMALEIFAKLEKQYKIRIPEEELPRLSNLNQTVDLVGRFIN